MTSILHRGNAISLNGEMPQTGEPAPDVTLVMEGMTEARLGEIAAKAKVILCMPSLDTSTCAAETRRFNEEVNGLENVITVVVTMDLPFAMKRFCETEGLKNIRNASDFRYREFAERYGVLISEGVLKGLHARAVFVLDENNVIRYSELVQDISSEPDYEAALGAVNQLLAGNSVPAA